MNRILILFCLGCLCINPQTILSKTLQRKAPPAPVKAAPTAPAQPRQMPYVLKKDYEAQMQEIDSKVRSAVNAGASARNALSGTVQKVSELGAKMQRVEEILNSANFKLALTSDSLKSTQISVEEFRKQTELSLDVIQAKNNELTNYIYILLGLCIILPIIVLIVLLISMGKFKSTLSKQSDIMNAGMKKFSAEMSEEMQSVKTKVQGEMYSLSTNLKVKMMHDKEESVTQINQLLQKLEEKQDKIIDEGAE